MGPLGERFWVGSPGYLHADGIVLHFVEVRVVRGHAVEELSPEELTVKGDRRVRVAEPFVQLGQLVVEEPRRDATESVKGSKLHLWKLSLQNDRVITVNMEPD